MIGFKCLKIKFTSYNKTVILFEYFFTKNNFFETK